MTVSVTVDAPAKINLALHVTGRRDDGFHLLDSLVGFAGICDRVTVSPADDITLTVTGPEADNVPTTDDNLAVQAAQFIRTLLNINTGVNIVLDKHIPVSAGLGGGSADAAAVLKACRRLWDKPLNNSIDDVALANVLGADVPVCHFGRAARVTGIGETVAAVTAWPNAWMVLVNPRVPLSTAQVFDAFSEPADEQQTESFIASGWGASAEDFADRLKQSQNSLTDTAKSLAPVIGEVLTALEAAPNCLLTRMSGSGPTCFSLFDTEAYAQAAAATLSAEESSWWVRSTQLLAETEHE